MSTNQLTVNPNEDLKEGTLYTVTVAGGAVKDEANSTLATPITVSFKTQEAQDTTAPTMVTATPNNAATNVEKNIKCSI